MGGRIMKYIPLSKKYYTESNFFETILNGRLCGEFTHIYNLEIAGNTAFIVPTFEICSLLADIYKSNNLLCAIRNKIPGVMLKKIMTDCLAEEIDQSNKIEGVASSKREVKESLENRHTKGKKKRFQGITAKYEMLIDESDYTVKSCGDVRKLYDELVLAEVIEENPDNAPDGEIFRHSEVDVLSDSGSGKSIHSGVYPESKIIDYMTHAIEILNDKSMPALVNIAVFHYLFGYIHPFYDGNGRLSRFISSCYIRKTLDPLVAFRLAYTIKKNVSEYYKIFDTVNSRKNYGDLTPFVTYFLEIIDSSVKELCEMLNYKVEKFKYFSEKLKEYFSNEKIEDKDVINISFILMQNALFVSEGLNVTELSGYLEISKSTLYRKIQKINKNLLSVTKDGKNVLYSLNLNFFEQS
jgi:Fic family protein